MYTLPNGLKVFNATPHSIRFWTEGWPDPVEVPTDTVINAIPTETPVGAFNTGYAHTGDVWLVRTGFSGNDAGRQIVEEAKAAGAHVIVGSIIAAQAYPGDVVAMSPVPGYERVAPDQKRMSPIKFTAF